jgi:hypothetical protein
MDCISMPLVGLFISSYIHRLILNLKDSSDSIFLIEAAHNLWAGVSVCLQLLSVPPYTCVTSGDKEVGFDL